MQIDATATEACVVGVWLLAVAALALSGCAPAVIGVGTTVGVAVAQERTVGRALDDAGIGLRIRQGLLERSSELFGQVGVDVVEGRVLLTGAVDNPEDRVEALRIAWQVPNVKEVLNEIEVADRGGIVGYATDARITSELRVRLLADREVTDINYTIDTVRGAVYLMGIARDAVELERVLDHVRRISGVRQVVNHVRLRDDPRRP